jgi:hypothetical protein
MKKKRFTLVDKTISLFICFVFICLVSQAQSPAANISGPLKATTNGQSITFKSQIAFSTQNPVFTFDFQNNTSGATIVSEGPFSYDPTTDTGTKTVIVNPGNSAGSFVIILTVKTPNGECTCSKSVTVFR